MTLPASGQQLFKGSLRERQNTPQMPIQMFIGSMSQRCQAAMAARGLTQETVGPVGRLILIFTVVVVFCCVSVVLFMQ